MANPTNPFGRVFISYRRKREDDVKLLAECLREHGIPTWQDVADLGHESTNDELVRTLKDPEISGAVLFITPEIRDSLTIQKVELPEILRRYDKRDGFFIHPVAAAGIEYEDVRTYAPDSLARHEVGGWNMVRAADPLSAEKAQEIATRVLRQRLQALRGTTDAGNALRICFDAKGFTGGPWALHLDWRHHFRATPTPEIWQLRLLPALQHVREELHRANFRILHATGSPSLPAALSLGATFPTTSRTDLSWLQRFPDGHEEAWSHHVERRACGFEVRENQSRLDGDAAAVLVSVADDVEPAFNATKAGRRYRGILHLRSPQFPARLDASSAVDLAHVTCNAMRQARRDWPDISRIDLFLSGPAGLAILIGQLTNTLPPIQLFEFRPSERRYTAAGVVASS